MRRVDSPELGATGQLLGERGGFLPGGASLHNRMSAHGPDAESTRRALTADLKPEKPADTLAFMLETSAVLCPTENALRLDQRQRNYDDCWQGLPKTFKDPTR